MQKGYISNMKLENKTIILHMGMPKTGSSSIQDTLYYDRKKLMIYGIIYANNTKPNHSDWIFNAFWDRNKNQRRLANRNLNEKEIQKKAINKFRETIYCFLSSNKSYLIFSAESIAGFTENSMKHLLDTIKSISPDINIIPILCVRNPIEYHTSLRQQILKKCRPPHNMNVYAFRKKLIVLYNCFPKENIIIYPFEEAKKHKNGIVGCFFEKLGLNQKIIDELNLLRSNESVSNIYIDLINYINSIEPELSSIQNAKDVEPLFIIKGSKFKLKSSDIIEYLDDFKLDVEYLKEKTGIDYLKYINNYTKYISDDEIIYPDTFGKNIESIYFLLNDYIKKNIKSYIKKKLTIVQDST